MRSAMILISLLAFCADAQAFSQKTAIKLEKAADNWESRSDFPEIMRRLDRLQPLIDQLCRKYGVDPSLISGLIITESGSRSDAVDFLFANGRSSESHVGLGQLSSSRLPRTERLNPRRIRAAKRWQRNQTRANLNSWARLDSRFDPTWNLEQTIASFANNQKRSGDKTLAIMAHHGGSNDPIRRVAHYARDHEGRRIRQHEVPSFVKKRNINYFTLYEDRSSRGHKYWAQKRESHLTYALNVMAASKAAGYTTLAEKPDQTALQEGAKKMELMNWAGAQLSVLWNDMVALAGNIWSVGWRLAVLLLVVLVVLTGLRHAVPPMVLIIAGMAKSLMAALPRAGNGLVSLYKVLLGTKKQRESALARMRASRKASAA